MEKSSERSFITGGTRGISHPVCLKGTSASSTLSAAAVTRPKIDAPISEIFEMFRIVSSEEATQLHHRNRSQLTEIIHIVADTADGEQIVNIVVELQL